MPAFAFDVKRSSAHVVNSGFNRVTDDNDAALCLIVMPVAAATSQGTAVAMSLEKISREMTGETRRRSKRLEELGYAGSTPHASYNPTTASGAPGCRQGSKALQATDLF